MSVLVGENGVDLFTEQGLVNAAMLACIPSPENPVCCMILLLPHLIVTQMTFVIALYVTSRCTLFTFLVFSTLQFKRYGKIFYFILKNS
jgi:hypothetical protein